MKLAGNSLRGHVNGDGSITFKCDDCKSLHRIVALTNEQRHEIIGPLASRPWSITQRKQRCPDCTVIARQRGWVK